MKSVVVVVVFFYFFWGGGGVELIASGKLMTVYLSDAAHSVFIFGKTNE